MLRIFSALAMEPVLLAREQGTLAVVRDIELSITHSYFKNLAASLRNYSGDVPL